MADSGNSGNSGNGGNGGAGGNGGHRDVTEEGLLRRYADLRGISVNEARRGFEEEAERLRSEEHNALRARFNALRRGGGGAGGNGGHRDVTEEGLLRRYTDLRGISVNEARRGFEEEAERLRSEEHNALRARFNALRRGGGGNSVTTGGRKKRKRKSKRKTTKRKTTKRKSKARMTTQKRKVNGVTRNVRISSTGRKYVLLKGRRHYL